jgi:hypothetical protein
MLHVRLARSGNQQLARPRLGLLLGGACRRSAAVRGQRGDRRGGLLCPRVLEACTLYLRCSETKLSYLARPVADLARLS